MKFLDICAGIGGFSLGLEMAGLTCAGQVEIDDWCNRVLAKHWPRVPRWRDVKELAPAELPSVELVCGGYPCQPVSSAGKRRGRKDDRYLWPYILPIVAEKRPAWCLFENVAGHVTLELDRVLSDLGDIGYSSQTLIIPACAADALHRRYRVWIIAHADRGGRQGSEHKELPQATGAAQDWSSLPPSSRSRISERYSLPASRLCRGVDGVPGGLDRIRGLGNAVVPRLVYEIGRAMLLAEAGRCEDAA